MKQSKTKLAIQNIKHIGIVGSGIAGLTFANSLVKRYNDLRYYEKLKLPKISIIGNSQNHSPEILPIVSDSTEESARFIEFNLWFACIDWSEFG